MDKDSLPNVPGAMKIKSMLFDDSTDEDDFEPLVFKRNVGATPAKRKSMLFEDFTDEDDFEPLVFTRNVGASHAAKRKSMLLEDFTDEDDFEPLVFKRSVGATPAAKPLACSAFSSAASSGTDSKAAVTGLGRKRKLVVHPCKLKYKIGMETEEMTAKQAQRQMHQFTSTVMELCTGFETSKKRNEELGKEVSELEDEIQKWKDEKARWDETKKEVEMERDEARKEAVFAVSEKRDMEDKAAKQVDDAKTCGKKAIYEAVASTSRCYKNFLANLVASLEKCEGESLKEGAKELIKEILCDDRGVADEAVDVAGDDTIKDKAP